MTFREFLTESALALKDFHKKSRYITFIDKIKKQKPFEVSKKYQSKYGKTVILDKSNLNKLSDPDLMPEIVTKSSKEVSKYIQIPSLLTTSGDEIRLSVLEKTKDFGSSGSRNAKITSINEGAQCVFLGIISKGLVPSLSNATKVNNYDIDVNLSEIKKISDHYLQSSIHGANALLKKYPCMSGMNFHRKSRYVKMIDDKYRELNRQVKLFGSMDKFNPSDIWVFSNQGLNDLSKLKDIKTWEHFSLFLKEKYDSRDIIGVSLKKVQSKTPPIKLYNYNPKKSLSNYLSSSVGKDDINDDSKSVYIYFTKDSKKQAIQFRSFQGTGLSNYAGEIIGKTSMAGKVGYGQISDYTKLSFGVSLPEHKTLVKKVQEKSKSLKKEMYVYVKEFYSITQMDFEKWYDTEDDVYVYTKYIGLFILYHLNQAGKVKQDKFVSLVTSYAYSEIAESSVFIKLGN